MDEISQDENILSVIVTGIQCGGDPHPGSTSTTTASERSAFQYTVLNVSDYCSRKYRVKSNKQIS